MSDGRPHGEIERRIVSVLFCDLAGYTSLSERLDAEDVAIVQAAYFDAVRDAVMRHGGTLEKFIGDAAVAVFGVPIAGEQDAERAVGCGLAVVGAVEQLSARVGLEDQALHVRVGVNTGEAVVHPDPAPGEAMVTGDVVNTAARLQAAAPFGQVLVGPETRLAVAHAFELEGADELELKGKAEPVRASRAISLLPQPERERAMGALRARTLGREDELARLAAALDACASGDVSRTTLVAPPGTGKSRLLEEVFVLASERGFAVRRARVRPDALTPFRPVVELVLDALAGALPAELRRSLEPVLGEERAAVVSDEVAQLLGGFEGAADPTEPEGRRAARFTAWSEALSGLAGLSGGAEVWLVEDVHWSAGDFRAFLEAATFGRGRLIVCTARPSIHETGPGWIAGGEVLTLEALSPVSAVALVRELVGEALPGELVERVAEVSGGNPLFVEELLRSWIGSGLLEPQGERWALTRLVDVVRLPSTVQSVYAAQLDDLPDAARSVVRRASVAGRQFPLDALSALGVDAANGIGPLVRRGIVSGPIADDLLGECFVIRHALLRDVGYASLSRAERARLHLRMARWLESVAGARPDELAELIGRHYAAALESAPALAPELGDGLTRKEGALLAAGWFERGAHAAVGASAYDAAGGLFERALELTPADAPLDRARRLVGFARATAFTADMAAALRSAEEALEVYRECLRQGTGTDETRDEASRAAALVGAIYGQQLRFHDVVALGVDSLAELGDRDDAVTLRLLLTTMRGAWMIGDEEWRRVEGDRTRALELAQKLGDPGLELEARICVASGEPATADWAAIERLASALRRWPDVADALRALAALHLPDEPRETLAGADRLASFAKAHQLDESSAWADYYCTEAHFVRGEWVEALETGLRALALAEERSYHRAAVRTWHVVVPIAAARGDRSTLERAVRWYETLGDDFPDTPYGRISRAGVEILFARAGVTGPYALAVGELGSSFAEGGSLPSWFELADVVLSEAIAIGELEPARRLLELFASAQEPQPSDEEELARKLMDARLRLAERSDPSAVREAARIFRSAGATWPLLKCLRLLQDRGAASQEELDEAVVQEQRLGIRS